MRICLIASQYFEDESSSYLPCLASGLASLGHEVTVVCSISRKDPTSKSSNNVTVVAVSPVGKSRNFQLSSKVMPVSLQSCLEHLNYWHAFTEIGDCKSGHAFDVVEASQPLAGALLSAFTREIPTVLRVDEQKAWPGDGFDEQFQLLVEDYAYACVDMFSCPSLLHAAYLQGVKKADAEQITVNSAGDPAQLASQALTIYESAITRFQSVKRPHIYKHGALRLIKSTEDMLSLYEKMLYDLLFRVSFRFRIGHWLSKFRANPRGFAQKVVRSLGNRS